MELPWIEWSGIGVAWVKDLKWTLTFDHCHHSSFHHHHLHLLRTRALIYRALKPFKEKQLDGNRINMYHHLKWIYLWFLQNVCAVRLHRGDNAVWVGVESNIYEISNPIITNILVFCHIIKLSFCFTVFHSASLCFTVFHSVPLCFTLFYSLLLPFTLL